MPSSEYVFIHPLLGADDAWSGYLVEPRPGTDSSEMLSSLCADPQLDDFDQRQKWFIPTCVSLSDTCRSNERSVIVFPATPAGHPDTESLGQLEAELRKASCKLALLATPGSRLPATGTWDYLLLGASHARSLPPYTLLGQASRTVVVAVDVHSHTDREWLLNNACTLSTCEFMLIRANPGAKADMTRIKLLELLALIADDADTPALEAIFRQESKLSYSLLRLVNSAAVAPRNPITSFAQAINLLGRRQLQRWLQLLVYADPNNGTHPNPLLQKAAARGRLLELLAPHLLPVPETEELDDAAFMVGTFSLLDVLLNMSMQEILQQLPLTEVVRGALAEHAGTLGKLLQAIEATEERDLAKSGQLLDGLGITGHRHLASQLEAFKWAAKIRPNV